jgi:hypothetical protein
VPESGLTDLEHPSVGQPVAVVSRSQTSRTALPENAAGRLISQQESMDVEVREVQVSVRLGSTLVMLKVNKLVHIFIPVSVNRRYRFSPFLGINHTICFPVAMLPESSVAAGVTAGLLSLRRIWPRGSSWQTGSASSHGMILTVG